MTRSNIFQWVGSLLVILSLLVYQTGGFAGPIVGAAASMFIVAWTIDVRAWGYFTLNVVLIAIHLWTTYEWSADATIARTFWSQVA